MKDEPRDVRFINYAGPGTYCVRSDRGAGDADTAEGPEEVIWATIDEMRYLVPMWYQ